MDFHLVHCFVLDLHTWRKTKKGQHTGDEKGKSNTTEMGEDEKRAGGLKPGLVQPEKIGLGWGLEALSS